MRLLFGNWRNVSLLQMPGTAPLFGNWRNESLLQMPGTAPASPIPTVGDADRTLMAFDVVILDYLLAAVAMHWPYSEDEVLRRVLRSVRPHGGLALLTGIEPYDLILDGHAHRDDRTVLDVEALGDAAALLAQRRTYRELPMDWVLRQVRLIGGFRVVATQTFPLHLTAHSMRSQLEFARAEAKHVGAPELRQALLAQAQRLQDGLARFSDHRHGLCYAIVFERL